MFSCVYVCEVTILPLSGFLRIVLRSSTLRPFTSQSNLRRNSFLTTLIMTFVTNISNGNRKLHRRQTEKLKSNIDNPRLSKSLDSSFQSPSIQSWRVSLFLPYNLVSSSITNGTLLCAFHSSCYLYRQF